MSEEHKTRAGAKASPPLCRSVAANTQERVAFLDAYPHWLVERIWHDYGPQEATRFFTTQDAKGLFLRIHRENDGESFLKQLDIDGIAFSQPYPEIKECILLHETPQLQSATLAPFYEIGAFYIQNPASQRVCGLANQFVRKNVLDLCAAPGGKISGLQISNAKAFAVEANSNRIPLMQENFTRLRKTVEVLQQSVLDSATLVSNADTIILDPPCSGLGVLAKHPEKRWTLSPEDADRLARTQTEMLHFCLQHMQKNAVLLYSVCTIDKTETERVVRSALDCNDNTRIIEQQTFLPDAFGHDAHYVAILQKS